MSLLHSKSVLRSVAPIFFLLACANCWSREPFTEEAVAPQQSKSPTGRSEPAKPQSETPAPDEMQSMLAQAQAALDRNDYQAAIPLLQKIVAQRPDDAVPHFELGYVYSEL